MSLPSVAHLEEGDPQSTASEEEMELRPVRAASSTPLPASMMSVSSSSNAAFVVEERLLRWYDYYKGGAMDSDRMFRALSDLMLHPADLLLRTKDAVTNVLAVL